MAAQHDISKRQKLTISLYCLGFLTVYVYFWWPALLLDNFSAWPWLIPFSTFVAVPVLDAIVGEYHHNWDEASQAWIRRQTWFNWLPLLAIPLFLAYQLLMLSFFVASTGVLAKIGWILSAGIAGGVMAINIAHELIHRKTKLEQRAGGLLLCAVAYGSFKVEHVYGHHVHVATPDDTTTAPKGMSIYQFWLRALTKTPLKALAIAKMRQQKQNTRFNEMAILYGISAVFLIAFTAFWGISGAIFWLGQSLIAILLLETVNYIEHYGLVRKKTDGKYEPITHVHSWNSSCTVTNFLLFNLQRHSDHHAYASRTYPTLRHFDDSPQMPQGYAAMLLLALVPGLWFSIMDPKLENQSPVQPA